ncbi:MAG TPA: hypothetical protein OIM61_04475 [Clostridiaceae bacterium]|nr:hypothetical protein [Clostridiaceae bacterium]
MIESNMIYNFEDFRALVSDKAKEGAYYLLYDDLYFEEIDKNTMITREAFTVAGRYTKSFNIIKYLDFKLKENYTTKELAEFIELLRKHTKILLTIYNPKKKDCFLLYISNKNDSKIENEVKSLLEMEQ